MCSVRPARRARFGAWVTERSVVPFLAARYCFGGETAGGQTPYAIAAERPVQSGFLPFALAGLRRAELPTFLYVRRPNPSLEN